MLGVGQWLCDDDAGDQRVVVQAVDGLEQRVRVIGEQEWLDADAPRGPLQAGGVEGGRLAGSGAQDRQARDAIRIALG